MGRRINPRGNAIPGKNRPEIVEKRRQALELRKGGASYGAIARQLGYFNEGGAYKAVMAALKATYQEPAEEVRTLEKERLDRLFLAYWQRALKGDVESARYLIDLMKRRAALGGLDAPTLINQTNETVLKWEDAEGTPDADDKPEAHDPDAPPPPGTAGGATFPREI